MEGNSWSWILQLLGRLHPLVVHFPIALLIVAYFLELLTLGGKRRGLREGINWMVFLGTLFAILATVLGWLLRTQDDYSGNLVMLHQNTGIATAVLAVVTSLVLRNTLNGKLKNFVLYRSTLSITVVFLIIAGHLGSSLTHGDDFLSSVLPNGKNINSSGKATALLAELDGSKTLTEEQETNLNLEVRAIFAHNCYQCHDENKQKGDLALDSKHGVFTGGESGPVVEAGNSAKSELYKRISLPPDHDDVMPKKGKVLKDHEIALIKLWIDVGAPWSDQALKVFPEAPLELVKPVLPEVDKVQHPVDKLVYRYFQDNGLEWSTVVDDRTFIRRAYLDAIGLLPDPDRVTRFVNDQQPDKRDRLIGELLGDNQNYTQHWLSFWNDLLRNDYSGPGFITGGRKQITGWLYNSLEVNKPYNIMVQELVDPGKGSEGFIKGIEWRGLVNASQRTEMQAAQNIGQSLLGVNVKCASCHNSFTSNLTLEQSYGFASIFADSVMELNRCDMPIGKMATVNFLYPELGSVEAETVEERLALLSQAITRPENGRLYRTITNRIWKRFMGRGIVEPVDEMDKTPWNAELLDWLASDFMESGYDLRHLIKMIMSSEIYQFPNVNYEGPEVLNSDYVFNGPILRRMGAEQFSDAVSQVVAPVFYAAAYDPTNEGLSASRIWHRELKYDRDVLPEPGKRYFRKTVAFLDKTVKKAELLISVDHSYVFYLNGNKVVEGTDWRKVGKLDVAQFLVPGDNQIAIEAVNEGEIANPAGILFAMKVTYDDNTEVMIRSDESWKSTDMPQQAGWEQLAFQDDTWDKTRNYGADYWGKLVNFSFSPDPPQFARASLVKQHSFMKALGRPSRENVITTRDSQATLLEALELTNGDYFNAVLKEGADVWLAKYGNDNAAIV
ncbi:MAG TPA: DUF1549 domain-containing protein, partial [Arenibacter sp.]|nr:DUF1549 domain-containing protein [Arenibacter sp.]